MLAELPRHHPHQPPLQYFNPEPKSSRNFSLAILHCILVSPSRSKQAALHLIPKNIPLVFILSYGLSVSLLTYRIPCVIFAFSPPPTPGISTHYSISGERLPKSCQLCPPSPSSPIKGEPILSIQVLSPHKVPSIRDVQIFPSPRNLLTRPLRPSGEVETGGRGDIPTPHDVKGPPPQGTQQRTRSTLLLFYSLCLL